MEKEIYLAGGCFWGVQHFFKKAPGVLSTTVGYANGQTLETSYDILKMTDHVENVYIKYDSNIVSLEQLLTYYFSIIDPTSLNRQGYDEGRQYRTGIYYKDREDLNVITKKMEEEQKKYSTDIKVEVKKINHFIPAEDYHQNYLEKHPDKECHIDMENAIKIFKKKKKKNIKRSLSFLSFFFYICLILTTTIFEIQL